MSGGARDSGFGLRDPSRVSRIANLESQRIPNPGSERIPNCEPRIPRLNAIIDVDAAERAGWTPIDLAHAFLAGDATFLQLRAKRLSGAAFLETATAIRALAGDRDARLIVNDRADIAALAGADGVHVGQEDLAPAAVRRIVGAAAIVGVSTHTLEQVDRAVDEPVSYIAIGPVFATDTKDTGYDAVGLDLVRAAAARARAAGLPLVAIGGITLERARDVIAAGASCVAVITDLLATGDPAARVRQYRHALA
jgi:thiamine-phosphate pyrophosphorylase